MKKIRLFLLLGGVFVLSGFLSYLFLFLSTAFREKTRTDSVAITPDTRVGDEIEDITYNVLLLGYGGAGHDGGTLSDVIMVANINPKEKKVSLISVPRDLWVEIPVRSDIKESYKINSAYAIGNNDTKYPLKEPIYKGEKGGATMAKTVVSEVVGMPIHYYIAVDFDNFKKIVDTLGGVEVDVPVAFDDYFYPVKGLENETCGKYSKEIAEFHAKYSGFELEKQFTCRYEHLHFDAGKQTMDGETALKFVRSRHSSQHGGDFARSQRQKAVLLGIEDKLLSLTAAKNAGELFDLFKGLVKSDLDKGFVIESTKDLSKVNQYKINFISLTEDNVLVATKSLDGQFILIPKEGEKIWSKVHTFIQEQI